MIKVCFKCKPCFYGRFNKHFISKINYGKMAKRLAAFDFDHTVIDDNSDTVVADLLVKGSIPQSVKQLYRNDGWTAYMQGIFELLFKYGISKNIITKAVTDIMPVFGIIELIQEITEQHNFDVIIISDSNTYFIDSWLEAHNLSSYIKRVYTNPAEFVDGLLKIEMYHLQDYCKLSTKNLCKGQILDDFIKEQQQNGVHYNQVIYVGDGLNDFCPILRLNCNDLGCVRETFRCAELVMRSQDGLPIEKTGQIYEIKAKVCVWKTGLDILKAIKAV